MRTLDDRHLVIVGMMATGKTTLGSALAQEFGRRLLDSDVDIGSLRNMTGREVAAETGVDELHDLEASILARHLAEPVPAVITAAASVIESEASRALLVARAFVVWIDVPTSVLAKRLRRGDHRRPMSRAELDERARVRAPLFAEVADVRVDGTLPLDQKVAAILDVFDT